MLFLLNLVPKIYSRGASNMAVFPPADALNTPSAPEIIPRLHRLSAPHPRTKACTASQLSWECGGPGIWVPATPALSTPHLPVRPHASQHQPWGGSRSCGWGRSQDSPTSTPGTDAGGTCAAHRLRAGHAGWQHSSALGQASRLPPLGRECVQLVGSPPPAPRPQWGGFRCSAPRKGCWAPCPWPGPHLLSMPWPHKSHSQPCLQWASQPWKEPRGPSASPDPRVSRWGNSRARLYAASVSPTRLRLFW